MYKRLFVLVLAAILTVGCNKLEKQKVEQLEKDLAELENAGTPAVPDAQEVNVPEDGAFTITLDAARYGVDAAGSVEVGYTLQEAAALEVNAKEGWTAKVNATDGKTGTITVTAPDPASPADVVLKATTAEGKTAAVVLPLMVRDPYTDATRTDVAAMGYFCFSPDVATDYHFKKMADAGFNMLTIESVDNWQEQLDLAHKYGMKGVLFVNGPAGDYYFDHNSTKLTEVIEEAKQHPALAAYQIFDEPHLRQIGQIKFEKDRIEELDPVHPVYVNLHPGSASINALGVDDYFEYVETMVTECNLKFITFDQYPVYVSGIDPSWHKSLVAIYTSAKKHNIPFWAFTLCCREYSRIDPTLENIRLQCNTNLFFGAQVNQYFVYRNTSGTNYAPLVVYEKQPDGSYIRVEKYTQVYEDCKAYNREMHNVGFVFADCNVKAVRNTKVINNWVEGFRISDLPKQIKNISAEGEALLSFIENKGNEYVAVMNSVWTMPKKIKVEITDMVYKIDHDGVFTQLDPGVHEVLLDGGDMVIFKVK